MLNVDLRWFSALKVTQWKWRIKFYVKERKWRLSCFLLSPFSWVPLVCPQSAGGLIRESEGSEMIQESKPRSSISSARFGLSWEVRPAFHGCFKCLNSIWNWISGGRIWKKQKTWLNKYYFLSKNTTWFPLYGKTGERKHISSDFLRIFRIFWQMHDWTFLQ